MAHLEDLAPKDPRVMRETPNLDADVVVVGSGAAGVSVTFPLVEAGLSVIMVDGGKGPRDPAPPRDFFASRLHDAEQWRWMVGSDFHALRFWDAVSPKLRVPTLSWVFEGFSEANKVQPSQFVAVGSLAAGGLTNAWGGGVACFDREDLRDFPIPWEEMQLSYANVSRRIGISGRVEDDLSAFFGLDQWAQEPLPLDALQAHLLARYSVWRHQLRKRGFTAGRARVAILSDPYQGRAACEQTGACLWGCPRQALYTASLDLQKLQQWPNLSYRPGFIVERVESKGGVVKVEGRGPGGTFRILARSAVLAAGTLATTRLALQALDYPGPVPMQSCPTAAFLLWVPRRFGYAPAKSYALGQISFHVKLDQGGSAFGSLFSAAGIPAFEFVRRMPLPKRHALRLLEAFLPCSIVGNLFLPGWLTEASLRLDAAGHLVVTGGWRERVSALMDSARATLAWAFRKVGAILVPKSFTLGVPGGDIHYAVSLPMRTDPRRGETFPDGQLAGAPGIFVADGAVLSALPAKSHTLTIMANADRIGRCLARALASLPRPR